MVLAEDTLQIAAGKKDGSGAGGPGDAGFFPIVKGGSGGSQVGCLATVARFSREAVRMTLAGT